MKAVCVNYTHKIKRDGYEPEPVDVAVAIVDLSRKCSCTHWPVLDVERQQYYD